VSPHQHHDPSIVAAIAVLTVSDTRTPETDRSGPAAMRLLEQAGHRVFEYEILPDEPDRVRRRVEAWLDADGSDGVVLNGGTGISVRDRTFEVVSDLLDKKLDGFGELFRALSFEQIGAAAMLSRAVGGVARGKLVFSLPGSTAAVELAMSRLIVPELGHLLGQLRR
jgi:molybdenum cofactor biosynthesis protein B